MNIEQVRIQAAKNLGGYPRSFDGTRAAYGDLSQAQQVALSDEVARIIKDNPETFDPEQVSLAKSITERETYGKPLEEYGIGAMAADFTREAASQGGQILSHNLAPLAFIGRNVVWLALAGSVAVGLWYFAPHLATPRQIAATIKKAKGRK